MINTIKPLNAQLKNGFQHNGSMLAAFIKLHSLNKAAIARLIGVKPSSISRNLEGESLQFRILWNLSLALKHNFLADLAAQLPTDIVVPIKTERESELEKELEKVKFELSIYKNIVGK